jgi:hypothetical protein
MASSPSPASPASGGPSVPATRPDHRRNSSTPAAYNASDAATPLPQTLWGLQVPLHITHASRPAAPFIVSVPRFSYLALLLPRLSAYYGVPCSSFHHEEIQLRNLAVGLLVDLYQPAALPWRLVVGDGPEWDIADTFTNSAKEADFVRNGNAKQIMSLSKEHSTALWNSVQDSKCAGQPASQPSHFPGHSRGVQDICLTRSQMTTPRSTRSTVACSTRQPRSGTCPSASTSLPRPTTQPTRRQDPSRLSRPWSRPDYPIVSRSLFRSLPFPPRP